MTTSAQQDVLSTEELEALRACARGETATDGIRAALAAKGMLASAEPRATLTPAGRHAIDVHSPGTVPGIDT